MSGNRSIAAAQRRRATPNTVEKNPPRTSINSSHIFNNEQSKQPTQEYQKLTIPQVITLITLRLGKLETTLDNISHELINNNVNGSTLNVNEHNESNVSLVDDDLISNIIERLESLEGKDTFPNPEIVSLKTSTEVLKTAVLQNKNANNPINKDLKKQMAGIKSDISTLQNITNEINESIYSLTLSKLTDEDQNEDDENENEENEENENENEENDDEIEVEIEV